MCRRRPEFDTADHAAAVARAAADRDRRADRQRAAGRRRCDRRGRRRGIRRCAGRDEALTQGGRLHAHVSEQVDGCLLHAGVGRRTGTVVRGVETHTHCTVPAPKTSAPLACRYKVSPSGSLFRMNRSNRSPGGPAPGTVVVDRRISPGGRKPLSASRPLVAQGSARHRRRGVRSQRGDRGVAPETIRPSAAGTTIEVVAPSLTMKSVPVSPFSGRPPSDGRLKRGSRQVPVHSGDGSIFALACVSL